MKWREDLEDFVMTKTKERRPISVESAGRVVGVIAVTLSGVRVGAEDSPQTLYADSYRGERAICGSRTRFAR